MWFYIGFFIHFFIYKICYSFIVKTKKHIWYLFCNILRAFYCVNINKNVNNTILRENVALTLNNNKECCFRAETCLCCPLLSQSSFPFMGRQLHWNLLSRLIVVSNVTDTHTQTHTGCRVVCLHNRVLVTRKARHETRNPSCHFVKTKVT
jgi:hypothetical protein